MSFLALLAAVAPVFLIIGAGYIIRRIHWLSVDADASLMRVIVNLLFPCLILDTILGNAALQKAGNVLLAPAVGFFTVVLGYLVCYYAAPLFGVRDTRQRRTFAFTAGIYNYAYVPLPLIPKLFPADAASTTAILFIHNVGVEIALWTAGVVLLTGAANPAGDERRWTHLFNGPVVAILAAIALHFCGARLWLPEIALSAIHSMGAAALPLGLILTGATFADQMRHLSIEGGASVSIGSVLLRLGIIPLLMLALARWLPCPIELRRIIVVQAAMPCALIPVLLSKHYGGDPGVAMRIVLVTTALGLVTIPLWIQAGLWWIHC
ncbi:MAG: Auxin Efflux Carrier [Chthoniobacteraceae bacterium]|nr:Auxin Efflux Carrier [Chthoniobacteraceae bacterium]